MISNGSDTRTIDVNDLSQVVFFNNSLLINPTEDLVPNTTYHVQMGSGVVADLLGNSFAGISDETHSTSQQCQSIAERAQFPGGFDKIAG